MIPIRQRRTPFAIIINMYIPAFFFKAPAVFSSNHKKKGEEATDALEISIQGLKEKANVGQTVLVSRVNCDAFTKEACMPFPDEYVFEGKTEAISYPPARLHTCTR